jgi:putative nucleotidyltransferase with HDIG domain
MQGPRETTPESASPSAEFNDSAIARRLAREFTAPVGLLDPTTLAWRARIGIDESFFPDADATLTAALSSGVMWHGRVNLWRPTRDVGPIWLCMPIPTLEGSTLLGLLPFVADPRPVESDPIGPHCPDRALRAWGQSVADGLRGEMFPRINPVPVTRKEGNERSLASRLIRRMRVSDTPEQFQELALGAVQSTLQAEAVAWVPSSTQDNVIVAGSVPGLKPAHYRSLVPTNLTKSFYLDNNATQVATATINGLAVVASESQSPTGCLVAVNLKDGRPFAVTEIEVLQPVASLIGTQRTNSRTYRDLKDMFIGVIRSLTRAIDAKDPYTSGHSERVGRIAQRLAQELGMNPTQKSDLYLMGLLHDVGKIGIDDGVLKKQGRLDPDEYRKIQSHVEIGVNILSDLKSMRHLLPGIEAHHENFDGTGYPHKLAGETIPITGRILAVADSFDAMSSKRPYRPQMPLHKIVEEFQKGMGSQWDPKIVEALLVAVHDIREITNKGLGKSIEEAVDRTTQTNKDHLI